MTKTQTIYDIVDINVQNTMDALTIPPVQSNASVTIPLKSIQSNASVTTPPRKRRKTYSIPTPIRSVLTPISTRIYEMLRNRISPTELNYKISTFLKNTKNYNLQMFLQSLLNEEEEMDHLLENNKDDDYVPYIKSQIIGKLIETQFNICPICIKQLHTFDNPCMPALDSFCSGYQTEEKHICVEESWLAQKNKSCIGKQFGFFFQIKTAINDSNYFTENEITPGSKKYNKLLLTMKPNSEKRKYAPNYICVRLEHKEDNIYRVSQNKSYMFLPNFDGNTPFFEYIDKYFYNKQKAKVTNCIVVSGTPLQNEIDINMLSGGGNIHKRKYIKLKKLIERLKND